MKEHQRTTHKEQMTKFPPPFKNRQKYNEDIPILQRQVENGEVKATQLPRCQSQLFLSFNNLKMFSCLVE